MKRILYSLPVATLPFSSVPKSAFIYATVLEGAIRSQVNDGPVTTCQAGQSFSERPGDRHGVSANASKTKPAKLLAVFVVIGHAVTWAIPHHKIQSAAPPSRAPRARNSAWTDDRSMARAGSARCDSGVGSEFNRRSRRTDLRQHLTPRASPRPCAKQGFAG
jgi:hypothetical protein